MDSQLATVLTSGSLDPQNGSRCAGGPEPVAGGGRDPEDKSPAECVPGNLQPSCPVRAAVTIIAQDAPSVNGRKPEGGGASKPASQEPGPIGGLRQPITVKTGVPVLRSQPIRIKIVVPPRCKRPISDSEAISLTKDFAHTHFRRLVTSGGRRRRFKIKIPARKHAGGVKEFTLRRTEGAQEPFQDTEPEGGDTEVSHTPAAGSLETIKEETAETCTPLVLPDAILDTGQKTTPEPEEQTEPLDLSLPKSQPRRCGGLLDDSGCETSLIMEVDEYEGDGDRDVVEEDDVDALEDSVLSPSFFSTSVLASLSSIDSDTENLLLIDDQGIPYTLDPQGGKVPLVHASASEDGSGSEPPRPAGESEGEESVRLGQSLENALNAPLEVHPARPPGGDSSPCADQAQAPDPSQASETQLVQEAVLSPPAGIPVSTQPIQLLANPSSSGPFLLLSSSSSSSSSHHPSSVGLSLPLSVAQPSPGASTPVFLLLSSVPSSSSSTSSTPIAVLDPSTGQLSQITAASAPLPLPLSSGQVLGSPLPILSHPVVLSGVNSLNAESALVSLAAAGVATSAPDLHGDRTTPALHPQSTSADSNPGSEAISEILNENNKPSTVDESSPPPPLTFDLSAQPNVEAGVQSPASEPRLEASDLHSEHLPLDDHIYFSNMAAPPSPSCGTADPSESLDPLDSLSRSESPNSMGARRVLYCQLCPRVFFYLSDLERHAITHSQKKPHVCQQCGKAFKRSSHLQRHKHIHTGQRNFVCPICAKRFREAGELQRHQRVHTGEKPYQCQLCHTRFAERNTLRRHTKRKHPYHQVAMEMLNERRGGGGGGGGGAGAGGGGGVAGGQEEEESAEWYSSTVSNLDNSESEVET